MLKEALQTIRESRAAAKRKAEADFLRALAIPEFMSLEKEKRRAAIDIGECAESDAARLKTLEKNFKAVEQKQRKLLSSLELSVEPVFSCKLCSDTGYSNGSQCACLKRVMRDIVRRSFGLSAGAPVSFSDCDRTGARSEKDKKIFEKIENDYCNKFPDTKIKNHVLSGAAGTGKTFLASCTAADLSEKGFDVFFITAHGLNSLFLNLHTAPVEEKAAVFGRLLSPDLLIIDDLGAEPVYKNVTVEYLLAVVSERLSNLSHTLITTNLTPPDLLTRYGERVFSRLNNKQNSRFLTFEGADRRLSGER